MIIVVRAVCYENNKHNPQVVLDECLFKYTDVKETESFCILHAF